MNRGDIDTEKVYRCTTGFTPTGDSYRNSSIIGLCKVVEIPASGHEVLVRQVNGRLEPRGKTIAARLSDIKVAGEHDIERALQETRWNEANAAWAKLAKEIRSEYNRLLKGLKITGTVQMADSMPYEYRYQKTAPAPEKITRAMVESYVKIEVKGPEFAKAMARFKAAYGPAVRKALDARVLARSARSVPRKKSPS